MRCLFIDYRTDFGSILSEKLGSGFLLQNGDTDSNPKDCAVVMVAVPTAIDPAFQKQLGALAGAARNTAGVPVVALLPASDRALILRAFSAGAYDCFIETGTLEELRIVLRRAAHFHELSQEVELLRTGADCRPGLETITTSNEKMRSLCVLLAKVAETSATVLLTGESGTGKGLLAGEIHKASPRR